MNRKETGIEELRVLVNMANYTSEWAFDGLNLKQTVTLLRACRALDLEVLPDQLTAGERESVAFSGQLSRKTLSRLYAAEGLAEDGPDWETLKERENKKSLAIQNQPVR